MSMNIRTTKPGDIVEYEFEEAGMPWQIRVAQQHLVKNQRYEVAEIDIKKWHTDVYLVEFPGIAFNSCLFGNVTNWKEFYPDKEEK